MIFQRHFKENGSGSKNSGDKNPHIFTYQGPQFQSNPGILGQVNNFFFFGQIVLRGCESCQAETEHLILRGHVVVAFLDMLLAFAAVGVLSRPIPGGSELALCKEAGKWPRPKAVLRLIGASVRDIFSIFNFFLSLC